MSLLRAFVALAMGSPLGAGWRGRDGQLPRRPPSRRCLVLIAVLIVGIPAAAMGEGSDHSHEGPSADGQEIVALARAADPKAALLDLRRRMTESDALAAACHPVVHALGREAYTRYGNLAEALGFADGVCNWGYLHGVLEGYFADTADPSNAMQSACAGYAVESLLGFECYHGVGHGLMLLTASDLRRSLDFCDAYAEKVARSSCHNGVFMEYFDAGRRPFAATSADALFAPCRDQKRKYKTDCYLYAPLHYLVVHEGDYAGALVWCTGAEPAYREICAAGVGSQAMKENVSAPRLVAARCSQGKGAYASACISGMVSLYINHHGSVEPAIALCATLDRDSRRVCDATVAMHLRRFKP